MSDLTEFRTELLDCLNARLPENPTSLDRDFAFSCEVVERLTQADELHDFIPFHYAGTGSRNRKVRVDGYEFDESDDSLRLVITELYGSNELTTLPKAKAETLFSQLIAFVEDSITGRIQKDNNIELAKLIADKHPNLVRYSLLLLTDSCLSDRVKDLEHGEIDGRQVDFHVWDAARLLAVSSSLLGIEELEIDFTSFVADGLPCLPASKSGDYQGFLAVIPGDVLANIYDTYGSKLLEGNVRSFLSVTGKINKGIQGTIKKEPERFFIYNNGICATATSANVVNSSNGPRLCSARYFQIVNGGQTTASLHLAKRKWNTDLSNIDVQMKLSVVSAKDMEKLDDMIQNIAIFSNKQNKVSDADFFSNHPYHRAIERLSRNLPAPAAEGAQYHTYWFYERARGQYKNAQTDLTLAKRREFQRIHPRSQLIVKTDLAKFENSWRQIPHIVSTGAQKNFSTFAEHIGSNWGECGALFNNEIYFKEVVARAIIFRFTEKMVSSAEWYQGGYRANIVTYSMAKLSNMIASQKPGHSLDFKKIWMKQGLSGPLRSQLTEIAIAVVDAITSPIIPQMNITEWCKKRECWDKVKELALELNRSLVKELVSPDDVSEIQKAKKVDGNENAAIEAITLVVQLGTHYWSSLAKWAMTHSPIYGTESDLVRNASRHGWIPTDRQAARLITLKQRIEAEGFKL